MKKLLSLLAFLFILSHSVYAQNFINAADYGVLPSNANNYAALTSLFSMFPNRDIYIPDGTYTVDNGTNDFVEIVGYNGHLLCGGKTVFSFIQPSFGGFHFDKCKGARLENLTVCYPVSPLKFTDKAGINIANSFNMVVQNIRVEGTGGVGIQFDSCINSQASNINIRNVKKDGCGFYYCQNSQLNGLITYNTGDDALSFVNVTDPRWPNFNVATATNLILRNSHSRGIAVLGMSDVSISNFSIDSTKAAGIYVAKESIQRRPYKIMISNGVVDHGGQKDSSSNPYGVHLANAGSVNIYNVKIKNSGTKGFVISSATDTASMLNEAAVANVEIENSGTIALSLESARRVSLNNITINNANEYGVRALSVADLTVSGLFVKNVQLVPLGSPFRAIWFEGCTSFFADNIVLINTNAASTTGYLIGETGTINKGYFGNIQQQIASTTTPFALSIGSLNVKTGLVNTAPYNGVLNGVVYQSGKQLKTTAAGTDGQLLSTSSGVPAWTNPIALGGSAPLNSVTTTVGIAPGFVPTAIVWTPTNLAGATQGNWYISDITATSFKVNYPGYTSGTITGNYIIVK